MPLAFLTIEQVVPGFGFSIVPVFTPWLSRTVEEPFPFGVIVPVLTP